MTGLCKEIGIDEIIHSVKGTQVSGPPDVRVKGVSTDSRSIKAEELFIALNGDNFDGHDFIGKAIEQGASCVIVQKGGRFEEFKRYRASIVEVPDTLKALGDLARWWRKRFNARVIAVTGSMGKTTTKEMVSSILELEGKTLKSEGNYNNLIGLPMTVFQLNEDHRYAVLEMGMNRPGEIGRLTEIAGPDTGVITNAGRVHLEGVGSLKGVAMAKTEMIRVIDARAEMILNGDDELLMETAMGFNRRVHTYGTRPNNEIRISRIEDEGQDGSRFVLEYDEETLEVRIHVPGFHNIMNAAAAASVAMLTGVDKEKISSGLKIYRGTQGRFTPLVISENITLLDDSYNSNPSSLRAMLQTVKAIAGGSRRIILALGEMLELGEETIPAHIEAGEMVAETKADLFLAMGEHAGYMLKGAVDRGFPSAIAVEVKSHEEMIEKIRDVMKENDLILVKGSRRIGLDRVVRGLREE